MGVRDAEGRRHRVVASSTMLPPWIAQVAAGRVVEALEQRAQGLGVGGIAGAGQLAAHARHPATHVGCDGCLLAWRRRLRHVLAQDRGLQRAQVGRGLDPESVDERPARALVGRERIRLPARAVEREHLLTAQPLAQRILAGQAHRARRRPRRAARRPGPRPRGRPGTRAAGPPAARSRAGRSVRGHVGQRRAAPEGERLPQRRRRLTRLAAGELCPAAAEERFEALGVERPRWQRDR